MLNLSIVIPIYKESQNIIKLVEGLTDNININNYEILFIKKNNTIL